MLQKIRVRWINSKTRPSRNKKKWSYWRRRVDCTCRHQQGFQRWISPSDSMQGGKQIGLLSRMSMEGVHQWISAVLPVMISSLKFTDGTRNTHKRPWAMPGALAGSKVFSRRGPGPRAAVGFEIGRDQARISRDQARGRDSGSEPRPE